MAESGAGGKMDGGNRMGAVGREHSVVGRVEIVEDREQSVY